MSKAKYDRNNVTFGPDRSDLEYKLDRIEEKAEDFKTDLEPVTGIVDGYDPITGIIDVIVDPNLPSIPVGNGSGVYPNPGDTMIIQPIAGEYYGTGIVQEVQFPDHSLLRFVVPSSVAGLPRIPSVEMVLGGQLSNNYLASGSDFVAFGTSNTNMLQVNISSGTSSSYVFPNAIGNIYTNGTTSVASNNVDNIYFLTGGVLTTVNYAGATRIKLAGHDSVLGYCFAVQSTTFCKAVMVNESTGVHTVQDITGVFPAYTTKYMVTRCGGGYFIMWNGGNVSTAGDSLGMWVYNGVTSTIFAGIDATTRINVSGKGGSSSPLYTAATGQGTGSLARLDMEGGYLYWMYNNTGFYKMDLSTGGLTLYNNILPVPIYSSDFGSSAVLVTIGAISGGTVVIAGTVTKTLLGLPGPGEMSVFFITDGVTTTLFVSDGDEGYDTDSHYALCSGNGSTGYVYYKLTGYDDYITGASI